MYSSCPNCNIKLNQDMVRTLKKMPSRNGGTTEIITMYYCKECGSSLPAEAIESIQSID